MRLFLAFGFLASIFQCGCLPIDILSDLSWPEESSLAAALTRVKKDTDGIEYLEECAFIDSWQEEPGFINVLAFLDASWEYSHRQATMLKMLQDRLKKSGIADIRFFVINSAQPEAAMNNVDVEDEKEAWGAVDPTEDQAFSEIEQTREALKDKIDPNIAFIQDNDKLKIWEKLSASRDQVIVIDKCGRLSYRVIVPWSILHFPYVKAAILSTYKEQPCGGCNFEITTVTQDTELQTEQLPELLVDNLNIKQMKEIAVKKYNLDQTDNTAKEVYRGAASPDIPANVIELLNGSVSVKHEVHTADFNNSIKLAPLTLLGNLSSNVSYVNEYSQVSNVTEDNNENDTVEIFADFNNSTKHRPLMSTGDSNTNVSYTNSYSQTPNSMEHSNDDNEEEILSTFGDNLNINESIKSQNYSNSSPTIINGNKEKIEFDFAHNIENESSTDNKKTVYFGNTHQVENSESTEFPALKNISNDYKEKENLDTDLPSLEVNKSSNSYINDDFSDSEVSNTSESLSDEQSDNRINKMAEASHESTEYVIPIRIIMHAPHIHKYEEPSKKYEYLVLKLGNPDYHGHLEYDNDFVSNDKISGFSANYNSNFANENVTDKETYEDEPESGEVGVASFESNYDTSNENENVLGEKNDKNEPGSGEIGGDDDSQNYENHRHHNHKGSYKHSTGKHLELVYDKDESPGFYGEDAEYWRNSGNGDYQEKMQIDQPEVHAEPKEKNEKQSEKYDDVNITKMIENSSTNIEQGKSDTNIEESIPRYQSSKTNVGYADSTEEVVQGETLILTQQIEKNSTTEEEIANHLFEHYSKLIPWLDYVIDP